MSFDSARIVCTGCDYETLEPFRPILIRYKTARGKIIELGRTCGWCYDCARYSDIERMNQEELGNSLISEKQERFEVLYLLDQWDRGFLSNFRHQSEKRQLWLRFAYLNKEITKLGELIEIAKRRKSKARCLNCWSDRTVPLTFDSEDNIAHDFQHECGGNLKIIRDHSGPRFFFRLSTYMLNEEGELLGKE